MILKINIVAWAILLSGTVHAESLQGKVIGITDGDTVKILDQNQVEYKIRLAGIDAPEKKQAYGQESKQALSDCAFEKIAIIDGNKKDRYGRIVGKVIVNGTDCNLRQIKLGMAWHYKKYESEQEVEDRSLYAQEEYLAQRDRRGLWNDNNPVSPWDYRQMVKVKKLH